MFQEYAELIGNRFLNKGYKKKCIQEEIKKVNVMYGNELLRDKNENTRR